MHVLTTINVMRLLLLGVALGVGQAAAREQAINLAPSTTTKTTPLKSGTPVIVAPKPLITQLTYAGSCVNKNSLITINGKNFGSSSSGKRIGFKNPGLHLHVPAKTWGATKITVRFPDSTQVRAGQKFYLGIENSSEKWLSNVDKPVTVCKSIKATTINKLPKASLSQSDSKSPNLQADSGFETSPLSEETIQDNITSFSGSALDSQLPPPPEDLPPLPVKKDKTIDPGELVVASTNMLQAQALAKKARALGLRIKRRRHLKSLGIVVSVFRVSKQVPVRDALQKLRRAAPKAWADTNARYQLQGGKSQRYGAKLIGWDTGPVNRHCGKGVRVGLVDTGVDKQHPALKGKAIITRSFLTPGINKAKLDHGTATASILVGNNKKLELTGLVQGAKLYVASVFRQRDRRNVDTTAEWIVMALDWLASQNTQLINLGLGGPRNLLVEAAIKRLLSRGIIVVAPAGNGGPNANPVYPAAQQGVIAVTAIDSALNPYNKANRGDYISFAAPGVDVWTARAGGGGMYVSGTSYATPFVTASIISGWQAHRKMPWQKLIKHLISSVRDLGRAGKDPTFGWGLVQAGGKCGK